MEFLSMVLAKASTVGITLLAFVFVLAIVVFIHELGHFLVGRWCGVEVKTFSIGFGRELFGWNDRHGTRWRLAAIPLGGYVKFAGDADGASTPDFEAIGHMSEREKQHSFYHKSVPQRSAIVAAGPIANFLLAIVIFAAMAYFFGRPVAPPRVEAVLPNSAAAQAGFEPGDVIVSIDGSTMNTFQDLQRYVSGRAGDAMHLVIDRQGRRIELSATPTAYEERTPFGKQRVGRLGISGPTEDRAHDRSHGVLESIGYGFKDTWFIVTATYNYLAKLIAGRESTDQLSGPIRIAQVSGQVFIAGGLLGLINLAAILSVSIGLINLMPVPLLDGGHLMYFLAEALRGKPLNEKVQEFGFRVGLAAVGLLMLFVTWNDLVFLKAYLGFSPT